MLILDGVHHREAPEHFVRERAPAPLQRHQHFPLGRRGRVRRVPVRHRHRHRGHVGVRLHHPPLELVQRCVADDNEVHGPGGVARRVEVQEVAAQVAARRRGRLDQGAAVAPAEDGEGVVAAAEVREHLRHPRAVVLQRLHEFGVHRLHLRTREGGWTLVDDCWTLGGWGGGGWGRAVP